MIATFLSFFAGFAQTSCLSIRNTVFYFGLVRFRAEIRHVKQFCINPIVSKLSRTISCVRIKYVCFFTLGQEILIVKKVNYSR